MSTATAVNPWTKKATASEGGDFERPPGGSYPGCLVALIDIGTHGSSYQGKMMEVHKVLLVFELTGEFDSKGETFKVMKDFTFSLHKKAHLRAFLEGWEGRKFADDEEIDLSSFMLKDGVVNLNEGTSGTGRKYVDLASVTKPFRGLTVPDRTVEPVVFSLDGWDPKQEPPIPEWVPFNYGRKVADEIKGSKEWTQLVPF